MSAPKINETDAWLRKTGKGYLADAAEVGKFDYLTAFCSALDQRTLDERLGDWDARRQSLTGTNHPDNAIWQRMTDNV